MKWPLPILLAALTGCHANIMPRTTVNRYYSPGAVPSETDIDPPLPSLMLPMNDPEPQWPQSTLAWDYQIEPAWFRVYGGSNPSRQDWAVLGETQDHTFALPRWQQGFFGVKAFNPVTQQESDWGTVQP